MSLATHSGQAPGDSAQLAYGQQWLHRMTGDPYGAVLTGFDDDPFPAYERIRSGGTLWRSPGGTWITADHRLGRALLDDPRLEPGPGDGGVDLFALLTRADPAGVRAVYRQMAGAAATVLDAAAAERIRPVVVARCAALLDRLPPDFDLVRDVAHRLPLDVIGELFGLSAAQRLRVTELADATGRGLDGLLCPQHRRHRRRLVAAVAQAHAFFDEAAAGMPGGPFAGLGRSTLRELGVSLTVLAVPMTAALVAQATLAAVRDADEWQRLAGAAERPAVVVHETWRLHPPLHLCPMRARTGLDLAGHRIGAGEPVVVVVAGANRDPQVFPEPERFWPDRAPGTPATGAPLDGSPYSSFAPLCRMQAEVALRTMAQRYPALRVRGPVQRRGRAPVTRALLSCPVTTRVAPERGRP